MVISMRWLHIIFINAKYLRFERKTSELKNNTVLVIENQRLKTDELINQIDALFRFVKKFQLDKIPAFLISNEIPQSVKPANFRLPNFSLQLCTTLTIQPLHWPMYIVPEIKIQNGRGSSKTSCIQNMQYFRG